MSSKTVRRLIVKCTVGTGTTGDTAGTGATEGTAGRAEAERCAQAFTVAATAVAAGAEVSLWLTGEAVWLAVPGRAEDFDLPHSAPLAELRDAVLAGGRLTVCTQCAARRGLTADDLIDGTVIAGAATFVDEVLRGDAQALVY
jgi:predicted peroxiredoxin